MTDKFEKCNYSRMSSEEIQQILNKKLNEFEQNFQAFPRRSSSASRNNIIGSNLTNSINENRISKKIQNSDNSSLLKIQQKTNSKEFGLGQSISQQMPNFQSGVLIGDKIHDFLEQNKENLSPLRDKNYLIHQQASNVSAKAIKSLQEKKKSIEEEKYNLQEQLAKINDENQTLKSEVLQLKEEIDQKDVALKNMTLAYEKESTKYFDLNQIMKIQINELTEKFENEKLKFEEEKHAMEIKIQNYYDQQLLNEKKIQKEKNETTSLKNLTQITKLSQKTNTDFLNKCDVPNAQQIIKLFQEYINLIDEIVSKFKKDIISSPFFKKNLTKKQKWESMILKALSDNDQKLVISKKIELNKKPLKNDSIVGVQKIDLDKIQVEKNKIVQDNTKTKPQDIQVRDFFSTPELASSVIPSEKSISSNGEHKLKSSLKLQTFTETLTDRKTSFYQDEVCHSLVQEEHKYKESIEQGELDFLNKKIYENETEITDLKKNYVSLLSKGCGKKESLGFGEIQEKINKIAEILQEKSEIGLNLRRRQRELVKHNIFKAKDEVIFQFQG